jgi:hypothetical protein
VPRIKNTNPCGDVWNVHTGFLAHGESVDVTDDVAAALLEQVGNFELDTADTED